jgi:hypothetical protein
MPNPRRGVVGSSLCGARRGFDAATCFEDAFGFAFVDAVGVGFAFADDFAFVDGLASASAGASAERAFRDLGCGSPSPCSATAGLDQAPPALAVARVLDRDAPGRQLVA